MKINIKEVEKGQIIRFGDHSHTVINEQIDCSGLLGEVVEINNHGNPDNLEIHIKLKSNQHEEILSDWDNCLVFLFPDDDFFDDVEVTIINAKDLLTRSIELLEAYRFGSIQTEKLDNQTDELLKHYKGENND